MSAFIVCDEHISAMLQAAMPRYPGDGSSYYWNNERHSLSGNYAIGQKLVDENYRSVNYRYDEDEEPRQFEYVPIRRYEAVEIIKACHCYEYQSCETPGWQETEAYAIVKALTRLATYKLPGYGDAQWEITK